MKKTAAAIILAIYCAAAGAAAENAPQKESAPLDMNAALDTLEAKLYWDTFFQSGILQMGSHKAAFQVGKKGEEGYILYDGSRLMLLPLPWNEEGTLRFPEKLISQLKETSILNKENEVLFKIAAVIVDPGHGGKDPGAVSKTVIDGKTVEIKEKDINLEVSKKLYEKLKKNLPDKQILITRTGDTCPTLGDRVAKAHSVQLKDNEAIIFISVHANFSYNKKARGYEVWYLPPEHKRQLLDKTKYDYSEDVLNILNEMMEEEYNRESVLIADFISKRISETFGAALPSRGLKPEEWYVVRKARMPSVLVELGFITNPLDAALMTSEEGLNKFADSIYKGLTDFIKSFENSGGFIAYE